MKRVIYSIISVLPLIFFQGFHCAYAHGFEGHKNDLKLVLFGEKAIEKSKNPNFDILCEAIWLTLDLTNREVLGKERLNNLKKRGVKNLPAYELISFNGNAYHQRYTHYGWEKGYDGLDSGCWEMRKQILLSTVEVLGKFKSDEEIKKDAFAALCYEIHILGDHIGGSERTRDTRIRLVSEPGYYGQKVSPNSDGPFNNPTLYTYLLYHIQRLFREQEYTSEYIRIVDYLMTNADSFYDFPVGLGERIPYLMIQEQAQETLKEMEKYIPKLLEREKFFKRMFG